MENNTAVTPDKDIIIDAHINSIYGGRGFQIHHENCTHGFPPMGKGKGPEIGEDTICPCGQKIHIVAQ